MVSRQGLSSPRQQRHLFPLLLSLALPTFFLLNIQLLPVVSSHSLTFEFSISPHEEECFLIRVPPKRASTLSESDPANQRAGTPVLDVDFEQMNEVFHEHEAMTRLQVLVMDETEKLLHQSPPNSDHDNFRVVLQRNASFWLCLQNVDTLAYEGGATATEKSEEITSREQATAAVLRAHEADVYTRHVSLHYDVYYTTEDDNIVVEPPPQREIVPVAGDHSKDWQSYGYSVKEALKTQIHHHEYMMVREKSHRETTEATFEVLLFWTVCEVLAVLLVAVGQIVYFRSFLEQKRYM